MCSYDSDKTCAPEPPETVDCETCECSIDWDSRDDFVCKGEGCKSVLCEECSKEWNGSCRPCLLRKSDN